MNKNWSSQSNHQPPKTWHQISWLIALIAFWQLIATVKLVNPLILPAFSNVLIRLISGLIEGTLALQLLQSIALVLLGLLVGNLMGLILAASDYFLPHLRPLITLLNAILHPLPGVALLPIVLLIAGLGTPAVLLIIIHATLWSSYLSYLSGFRSVTQEHLDIASNLGAGRLQVLWHVLLPLSKSQLLTGLQIGWSRGWRALVSAEMIFSAIGNLGGIGWYLFERRAFMDIEGVYAGIILIILTGFAMETLVFKKWQPNQARIS
ncbi:MAG: ABC transporter permease subunit [Eubacteriales bacterium]|nr:ABC transporter permease subunit [Eubacteriales bacterium]